jgi:hypothetical protein
MCDSARFGAHFPFEGWDTMEWDKAGGAVVGPTRFRYLVTGCPPGSSAAAPCAASDTVPVASDLPPAPGGDEVRGEGDRVVVFV